MGSSPISGFPYPNSGDSPLVHTAIQALATAIEKKAVMVFSGTSDRTTKVPSPITGMFCYRTDTGAFEFYNGSAWKTFVGYDSLARTKSIRPAAATINITSTSFVSYPSASITFPKLYAASYLRFHVEHSAYIGAGDPTGTELYVAVSFNGSDNQVNTFMFGVVGAHQTFNGTVDLGAGVAAGNYTSQLKYKLVSATGGRVIKMDANDQLFMSVEEIQAL